MRKNDEVPTTDLYLPSVMDRQQCPKHKAPQGVPCFHIPRVKGGYFGAVCNKRAKRAGFNAPIQERSLRMNRGKR